MRCRESPSINNNGSPASSTRRTAPLRQAKVLLKAQSVKAPGEEPHDTRMEPPLLSPILSAEARDSRLTERRGKFPNSTFVGEVAWKPDHTPVLPSQLCQTLKLSRRSAYFYHLNSFRQEFAEPELGTESSSIASP